jgi:dUTP pyrophosphatase
MIIKCVRRHKNAILPSRAHETDVGYDLTAIRKHKVLENGVILYDTGVGVTPPPGYYIEIVPRSSISKTGYMLANSVGTIDPDYTGNLYLALIKVVPDAPELRLPFTKCQFVLHRAYYGNVKEVSSLCPTDRGAGGFGSTGSRITK